MLNMEKKFKYHKEENGTLIPIKAFNFKAKTIQPTKKEEADFVKNLKPSEKVYAVKKLKSHEEIYGIYDWDGKVYYTFWERIIRKILKKDWWEI